MIDSTLSARSRTNHVDRGRPDVVPRPRRLSWRELIADPRVLVSLPIGLYVLMFPYARSVVGDVVGALSSIPVLIAGTLLTRKKIWVVALLLIAVNGVLFAVTEVDVERNTEWQGAALGSITLLITAELMGRVRESARRLKKSGDSKDRFLAGVSHELRTPLTAVVGFPSILKAGWPKLSVTRGRSWWACCISNRARWPASWRTSSSPPGSTPTSCRCQSAAFRWPVRRRR